MIPPKSFSCFSNDKDKRWKIQRPPHIIPQLVQDIKTISNITIFETDSLASKSPALLINRGFMSGQKRLFHCWISAIMITAMMMIASSADNRKWTVSRISSQHRFERLFSHIYYIHWCGRGLLNFWFAPVHLQGVKKGQTLNPPTAVILRRQYPWILLENVARLRLSLVPAASSQSSFIARNFGQLSESGNEASWFFYRNQRKVTYGIKAEKILPKSSLFRKSTSSARVTFIFWNGKSINCWCALVK